MSVIRQREFTDELPQMPAWCAAPAIRWLVTEGRGSATTRELLGELCRRLVEQGVSLTRVTVHARILHPQLLGLDYRWRAGDESAGEIGREHGIQNTAAYLRGPLPAVLEKGLVIRRRLEGPAAVLDFPILEDIRGDGATDYIAMPLSFSHSRGAAITFATDRPGGFTPDEERLFNDMLPFLSMVIELRITSRMAATLLGTYLGRDAGGRVLDGTVTRGTGESIRAVIWTCDLRGFTGISDSQPATDTIAMLNAFFDCTVGPVEAHGGEVLKFVGDGFLAIFRREEDGGEARACKVLDAAAQAIERVEALNRTRADGGEPALDFGLALHEGEVMYGNIGAAGRLDFTVIGPAVNLAARLEGLSKTLGRKPLLSADFARHCPRALDSLGQHALRGLGAPIEVFAPPEMGRRAANAVR